MSPEIRERLAKAAYTASREVCGFSLTWDELAEPEVRQAYRAEAEAVVLALAELGEPAFQQALFDLIGRHGKS